MHFKYALIFVILMRLDSAYHLLPCLSVDSAIRNCLKVAHFHLWIQDCRKHIIHKAKNNSGQETHAPKTTPCVIDAHIQNEVRTVCQSVTDTLQFFVQLGDNYKKLEVWLVVDQEVSVHQIPLSNLSLRDNKWHTLDIGVASSTSASSGQELTVQLDDFTIWKQSAFDWMVNASRLGIVVKASGTSSWIFPGRPPCNDTAPKGKSASSLPAPVEETEDTIISGVRTIKKIEENSWPFAMLLSVGCVCVLFMFSTLCLTVKIFKQKEAARVKTSQCSTEDLYSYLDHIFTSPNLSPEYANMSRQYIPNPKFN